MKKNCAKKKKNGRKRIWRLQRSSLAKRKNMKWEYTNNKNMKKSMLSRRTRGSNATKGMQRRRLHKKNDEEKKEKQFLKLTLWNTMVQSEATVYCSLNLASWSGADIFEHLHSQGAFAPHFRAVTDQHATLPKLPVPRRSIVYQAHGRPTNNNQCGQLCCWWARSPRSSLLLVTLAACQIRL